MRDADLPFEIARTTGPGNATQIAKASFDDGIDVIAVVGGDGTLNEVVQAFVTDDGVARKGPDLAVIPLGTGGDFKRSLGLTGDVEQAVRRIRSAAPRWVDLSVMRLVDFEGHTVTRAFINITSFGIGGVTDKLVNEAPKWLGGKLSFFVGSARAMLRYRNEPVRVRVDGRTFVEGPVFNVAMANGRFFGGGMMIAPNADLSDGVLDVVCLGNMRRTEALALSNKIYKGTHLSNAKVSVTRGAEIEAEPVHSDQTILLDMDGETPGMLPIHVRVAPGLIRVRA